MVQKNDQPGDDRPALRKLRRLVGQIRTGIDPNVTAGLIDTFLVVAMNEGKSLNEIGDLVGSGKSTVSRQLLDLGERNRRMEPGYGLVSRDVNPMNLRENRYGITPKGRMLLNSLIDALED